LAITNTAGLNSEFFQAFSKRDSITFLKYIADILTKFILISNYISSKLRAFKNYFFKKRGMVLFFVTFGEIQSLFLSNEIFLVDLSVGVNGLDVMWL